MYISYSGHKTYRECPRQYWHRYIAKTTLPVPDNRVNTLYGSVVGLLFEEFYRDKIWLRTNVPSILEGRVDPLLDSTIQGCLRDGAVNWTDPKANYKSRETLRADIVESIPRGIGIIRHHRLLGPQADAEVVLDRTIEGHKIGGRADFIIRRVRPHGDLLLLDGKGSRHRDKYVDHRQLWWYAMLYRDQHGVTPDKLGFVFWRQPPEKSLDWVTFDGPSLDDLLASVLTDIQTIEEAKRRLPVLPDQPLRDSSYMAELAELFPTYMGGKCSLCAYLPVCREGLAYTGQKTTVPDCGDGVEDFGF